jgi:hypothetical protein
MLSDRALDLSELAVEEVDLTQTAVDGLALVDRQRLLGQPLAALAAEQVAGRRAALEVAHQHGVDLVLAARALAHQLGAPSEPAAQRPGVLVGHPAHGQQIGVEQPRERAGVQAIGLDPRLGDRLEILRAGHHDTRGVRLEQPRDPQRVAGRLQRDLIARRQTVGEHLQRFRIGRDAAGRAHTAVLADRDLAEIAVNIEAE